LRRDQGVHDLAGASPAFAGIFGASDELSAMLEHELGASNLHGDMRMPNLDANPEPVLPLVVPDPFAPKEGK
jgi:hypothetical protein